MESSRAEVDFALGALGGRLGKAGVYAYGPQYGSGAAVINLR